MATIGALYPTLVDIAKRTDPNGSIANVIEMLAKVNPMLDDFAWREGNLPTGHTYTARTALPSPTWRKFNQGVSPTKSQAETYTETCGMLDAFSKVDCALANLNGNAAAFRADEDNTFVQGFNQTVGSALFYESVTTNPERIHGLAPRFGATANNAASTHIIKFDSSASGADQTSIWLVGWSPKTVFGIYPKGSKAGLSSEDLGKQLTEDADGKEYTAWVTHWMWQLGLVVQDWRYVVRGCNIDTSAWKEDLTAGADLVMGMNKMYSAMFEMNTVQPIFYMNRDCFAMFNAQLIKKGTTNLLEWLDRGGRRIPHFLDVPIRITDMITSAESVVS